MNAIILSIGDELVLGQTIDTNSAWLSQQLAAVGCDISGHITVPDDQKRIEHAIRDSAPRCDFLMISGGIGPTEDDLTRQALAAVLGVELEMNERWLHRLRAFFRARGRDMPETNKIQAMIPRGATFIENTCGTAAGMSASLDGRCKVFVVPGVPKEMKAMFARDVLPHIQGCTSGACILSRTLHTFGLGESFVAEKLGPLMNRDRNPSVGTTVSHGIVSLRINSRFESRDLAQLHLDETVNACRDVLGTIIYADEETTLAEVVATMLQNSPLPKFVVGIDHEQNMMTARERVFTVATAESCTGGLLAKMLTDIPGSSAYFKQGWVTYSNESKESQLHVPRGLIEQFGAVSEAVVKVMANSARSRAGADFALAISGVAGPGGGTPEKPVGTVCIGFAHDRGVETRTFHFSGDREMIRDRSAKMALSMLRYRLLDKPMPF